MKALITRKIGMASTVSQDGTVVGVTLLSAEPNTVTQLKNLDVDGYCAVQLGLGNSKKINKPMAGHLKAAKATTPIMCEIRTEELPEDLKVGDNLTAEVFSIGDSVKATGTSKGKGWAGTIRRHNFHRGRKTHGGRSYRRPGSIGSMYPQHIFKGTRMAGQLGDKKVSVKNLKIALVDMELNVIGVVGAVPGPRKGLVLLQGAEK